MKKLNMMQKSMKLHGNLLVFPGIFKGALEFRATEINEEMRFEATKVIAAFVSDTELKEDYIIPDCFDKRVSDAVADAIKRVAIKNKLVRVVNG